MRVDFSLEEFSRNNKKFFTSLYSKFPEYTTEMAEVLAEEIADRARDNIEVGRDMVPVYFASEKVGENTPQFTSDGAKLRRRESNRNSWEPLRDTDDLLNSIYVEDIRGSRFEAFFTIASSHPGAVKHEFGGENPWGLNDIPARPFLHPAFDWAKTDHGFKRYFNRKINQLISQLIHESLNGS